MKKQLILAAKFQSQALAITAKEYEAPWLKNSKTVTRDASGRFSSGGGGGEGEDIEDEDIEEDEIEDSEGSSVDATPLINRYSQQLQKSAQKMSAETQKKVIAALDSLEMTKVKKRISDAFHEADVEAGKAFDQVVAKMQKPKEPEPEPTVGERIKRGAAECLQVAKERPGMVALGALGGMFLWTGVSSTFGGGAAALLGVVDPKIKGEDMLELIGTGAAQGAVGGVMVAIGWEMLKKATKELKAQYKADFTPEQEEKIDTLSGKLEKIIKEETNKLKSKK